MNGQWVGSFNLGDDTSSVGVDINDRGDWIAAGEDGVVLNGEWVGSFNLGDDESGADAAINERGDWIAAGEDGIVVNGDRKSTRHNSRHTSS
ncbi:MAG: hypothetical protein AB1758_21030, partial [Candidatus Eremiobacterota bacterium]